MLAVLEAQRRLDQMSADYDQRVARRGPIQAMDRHAGALQQLAEGGRAADRRFAQPVPFMANAEGHGLGARGLVADHADLVAVGVAHIGAVIVGMIVLAQARLAFVLAAGGDGGGVGGIDGRPVACFQSDGDAVAHGRRLLVERCDDPQLRSPARAAVARGLGIVGEPGEAQGLAHPVVEGLGASDVVGAHGNVAEHDLLLLSDYAGRPRPSRARHCFHSSRYVPTRLAASAIVDGATSSPSCCNSALTSPSPITATSWRFHSSTIGAGTPEDAKTPNHSGISSAGRPSSFAVGTFAAKGDRAAPDERTILRRGPR